MVKPSDLEENHIEKNITKLETPQKDVTKSTKTETKQDTPLQQFKPENVTKLKIKNCCFILLV